MAVQLPNGKNQFFDASGNMLAGGRLYTYAPGTSTPKAAYTTSAGDVAHTNPIVLDSRGEAAIYWTGAYDVVLRTSADSLIWGPERLEEPASGATFTDFVADLADTSTVGNGDALVGVKRTAANAVGMTLHAWHEAQVFNVKEFGAAGDGVTDDATALTRAIAAAVSAGGGVVFLPSGTYSVASQVTLSSQVRLVGAGFSEIDGSGSSNRGASCILRAFTGSSATLLVSGDDCGIDALDFDNNAQGTGECVQVTGSRVDIGSASFRNSGGDGLRIGKTDTGVSAANANAWTAKKVIVCGNAAAGMRVDDTNTDTSTSYPLGLANANAGYCALVDARNNGTDGLQLGNCNDNVFSMVVSQSNAGCGIRFKTDGTNAGPRCNHILGNDCEANTGNDIQIDAATNPTAAPGLYNVVLGNRSVAVASRIVDNSTGSWVSEWVAGLPYRAYHHGSNLNTLSTTGNAGFNAYVGSNNAQVRFYGVASGTVDSIAGCAVRKNGAGEADGWRVNQYAVFQPYNNHLAVTYSTSITIDAAQGHTFQINATNGTAFTINAPSNPYTGQVIRIQIRNTSGGSLGAITWDSVFKLASWTSPSTGFSRTIEFFYNGANWIEATRTAADIPN
jgi:Pectate lyase superfamily protein